MHMPRKQKIWPPAAENAKPERPISAHYPVIDTDLARDNLENDLPESDKADLTKRRLT